MLRVKFEVEKVADCDTSITVRKFMLDEWVEQYGDDAGYILACKVADFMEAIVKCLEDDDDNIDALRMLVKDKARLVGK